MNLELLEKVLTIQKVLTIKKLLRETALTSEQYKKIEDFVDRYLDGLLGIERKTEIAN